MEYPTGKVHTKLNFMLLKCINILNDRFCLLKYFLILRLLKNKIQYGKNFDIL